MRRFKIVLSILTALSMGIAAYGQAAGETRITKGIGLFGEGRYSDALEIFNGVLADPGASNQRADAMYWSSVSYMALGDNGNAQRSLDAFLKEYPRNAFYPDALYQRGRISYVTGDYEEGIRLFGSFLDKYPDHSFYSSALFWTGECLFSLGRLSEAESIFRTILKDHAGSVKYEAAGYKIALIRYKYRENELLTLLKWSHEESLRVIEEFQRREKAYEQALSVYQRRLSEAGVQVPESAGEDSDESMSARIAALNARVEELTRALEAGVGSPSKGTESLLTLKKEALDLMESYVDWLARNAEKEVRP